jgi:class 3 adenylate cyclase
MSPLVPFAEDLARARAKARENRASPQRQLVARMQADAEGLQQATVDVKSRNRARLIARELQRLAGELAQLDELR